MHKEQESHAIAGRTMRCRCKFWYIPFKVIHFAINYKPARKQLLG